MPYYQCKKGSNKLLVEQVTITGYYSNGVNPSNGNIYGQSSSLTVPNIGFKLADITGSSDTGTGNNIDVSGKDTVVLSGTPVSINFHN